MKNNLNLLSALLVDGIKNSVIDELKNNKEKLQESPQAWDERTVEVYLINETDVNLILVSADLTSGVWLAGPPKVIAPSETGIFESGSNAWLTGTSGSVQYKTDDDLLQFSWSNPYWGSNSYNQNSVNKKHELSRIGGNGTTARVKWTIRRASA